MSSKKFISARPDQNNGTSNGSYDIGTSLHLRASSKRQENLQAYGYHLTKCDNLRVKLDESAETANIKNYEANNAPTIITIPTFDDDVVDVENPFPDLDDEEFYAMLQYAEMIHEAGHYEHTDQPSAGEEFERLEGRIRELPRPLHQFTAKLMKDLWNAIEDGAMEEAIRNERGQRAAQRLAIKNETFIAQSAKDYPEHVTQNIPFDMALHIAAMDLAKYDTGALRRLFDDEDPSWQFADAEAEETFMKLYDDLRRTVEDAMTTPNPAARTERIFSFLHDVVDVIEEKADEIEEMDTGEENRQQLQQGQTDDMENQSGQAQTQQSQGLDQNDREDVAQQHANVTQQTVTTEDPDGDDTDGSNSPDSPDGDDGQSESPSSGGESDQSQQGGDEQSADGNDGSSNGEAESADGDSDASDAGSETGSDGESGTSGSEDLGAGDDASTDSDPICPDCGTTDVERLVQEVDGMIAARVNAPFDITADWVDSITFISNDEICGFRVATSGTVPTESIEQNGFKVVAVDDGVEVLEPRNRYDDRESVNGFECDACGYAWVPTISGDTA